MQICITPELDRIIQQKLASGKYASGEYVLLAALSALDAEEQTLAAIAEGDADVRAGRYRPFQETIAEI